MSGTQGERVDVPVGEEFEAVPADKAHSTLKEGLRSCRAVVKNYRSLLWANVDVASAQAGELSEAELDGRSVPGALPSEDS